MAAQMTFAPHLKETLAGKVWRFSLVAAGQAASDAYWMAERLSMRQHNMSVTPPSMRFGAQGRGISVCCIP